MNHTFKTVTPPVARKFAPVTFPSASERPSVSGTVNSSLSIRAEDGVIWVYSLGDDGVMAFTDLGIENLVELTKIHKDQKPREGR